jgi:hypothetical protein
MTKRKSEPTPQKKNEQRPNSKKAKCGRWRAEARRYACSRKNKTMTEQRPNSKKSKSANRRAAAMRKTKQQPNPNQRTERRPSNRQTANANAN